MSPLSSVKLRMISNSVPSPERPRTTRFQLTGASGRALLLKTCSAHTTVAANMSINASVA